MNKVSVLGLLIGSILEWYDFTLYGFLILIIVKVFFPIHNNFALIYAYGTFAVSYLARPIGAFFFSHIGDKYGRKLAFSVSIILMGISSFIIGLLPTYSQIDIFAPLLLLFMRILQGISCGGEFIGSIIYMGENSCPKKINFYTSLAWVGSLLGTFLSSFIIICTIFFIGKSSFYLWGWRIPYIFGGIVTIYGLYIRYYLAESTEFNYIKINKSTSSLPLRQVFLLNKKSLFLILASTIVIAVTSYMFIIYLPTYLQNVTGLSLNTAIIFSNIYILCLILLIPIFGYFSDQQTSKKVLISASFGMVLFVMPAFWFISHSNILYMCIGGVLFLVPTAALLGAFPGWLMVKAPCYLRFTLLSIPYNLAMTLFGGTTPLIASYLLKTTGNHLSPAYFLVICALISLTAISIIQDNN